MVKGLSLFANIGIGETYLEEIGIDIVVVNELLPSRCEIYKHFNPNANVISGDITNKKIFDKIIECSILNDVKFIVATPPCQGMSTAGKMSEDDPRNTLIVKAIQALNKIKPDYMVIENVPQMLNTSIVYRNELINIKDFIISQTKKDYEVKFDIFDAADYGTAQHRKRTIVRIYKKGLVWEDPVKQKQITVKEVIGDLPSLGSGEKSIIHPYHFSKVHNINHIKWLSHTPTGKTALDNKYPYYPVKNGRPIKGFKTTYKRIDWNKPCPTVTMGNGSISSQNNVHPGRLLKNGLYSDARVLSLLEIFRVMGLPDNWSPPLNITENELRHVIGEAVPPIMMKEICKGIKF